LGFVLSRNFVVALLVIPRRTEVLPLAPLWRNGYRLFTAFFPGEVNIMLVRRVAARRLTLSVATAALLAGCAATPLGPTVSVMPGPGKTLYAFQTDNSACRAFAAEQVRGRAEAANQRAVGTALLSAALGASVGAAGGALGGDAGGGAAVGSALGAGAGTAIAANNNSAEQMGIQAQYDNAFSQCMYTKGEQVPGFARVAASAPLMGAPDPLIRATQSELIRLGFLNGAADGYAGPRTRGAISGFEQSNGLPVDGSSSPRLLARLQATPTSGAATASPPGNWVQPTGTSNWVPPTGTASATPASSSAAPSGWVAPTKSQ
jgi:hypothetical protein